jgi:hypothetical protein
VQFYAVGPSAPNAVIRSRLLKAVRKPDPVLASEPGRDMTVSAVSFYRGGTMENVTPLAKRMKAILLKYGITYQVSRVQTDQTVGEWMVVVQYADETAYIKALEDFSHDPEHRQVVTEISKIVALIRRDLVVELDL